MDNISVLRHIKYKLILKKEYCCEHSILFKTTKQKFIKKFLIALLKVKNFMK